MNRIMGCIILAKHGLAMPPLSPVAQHGIAMQQSIMQFMGIAQQFGQQPIGGAKHGFMHGSMHATGIE